MIWNPAAETMDRREIERLQLERLRESLAWAETRVPFYRDRLNRPRVVPEKFQRLEDLGRLPFTEKAHLREHYPWTAVRPSRPSPCTWSPRSGSWSNGRLRLLASGGGDMSTRVAERLRGHLGPESGDRHRAPQNHPSERGQGRESGRRRVTVGAPRFTNLT